MVPHTVEVLTQENTKLLERAQKAEAALADEKLMYTEMKTQRDEAHLRWEALGKLYETATKDCECYLIPGVTAMEVEARWVCKHCRRPTVKSEKARDPAFFLTGGVHSCHDNCPRFMCVVRRVLEAAMLAYKTEEGMEVYPIPAVLIQKLRVAFSNVPERDRLIARAFIRNSYELTNTEVDNMIIDALKERT